MPLELSSSLGYRKYRNISLLLLLALLVALIPLELPQDNSLRAQPLLLNMASQQPQSQVSVIIQKQGTASSVETEVQSLGGYITQELDIINAFAAQIQASKVPQVAQLSGVRWISFDAPVVKNVTYSDRNNQTVASSYLDTINVAPAWTKYKGDGVGVAIVDSGINIGPDFYLTNTSTSRLVASINTYDSAPSGVGAAYIFEAEQSTGSLPIVTDSGFSGGKGVDYSSSGGWGCFSLNIPAPGNYTFQYRVKKTADSGIVQFVFNGSYQGTAQDLYASSPAFATLTSGKSYFTAGYGNFCFRPAGKNTASSGYHGYFDDFQLIGEAGSAPAPTINNIYDSYGHGTHVAGIVAGSGQSSGPLYVGVAPHANLINVKISDSNGVSRLSGVVAGLQWIYNNRKTYNIRVVNLSLNSATPESYNTSPLCAAAEMLWFSGVVVVTSAGNSGNQGILPPANDPFVITVGATDDKGTAGLSDDTMASFSSYGTTKDGFAKPDLVAPGTKITSVGTPNGYLNNNYPGASSLAPYISLSGTSMAAPMVSGAAALILQSNPNLTPNQVKYRLLSTARPFDTSTRAGAGYLNVGAAVYSTSTASQPSNFPISRLLNTTFGYSASATVNWSTVNWSTVNWSTVNWSTVNWSTVNWSTVNWSSDYWGP